MAARNLTEAIHIGLSTAPVREIEQHVTVEVRDFLAHSVARHCKKTNTLDKYDILTEFIQDILKDIPAIKGRK